MQADSSGNAKQKEIASFEQERMELAVALRSFHEVQD